MPNKHQYGQLLKRCNALADAWKLYFEGEDMQRRYDYVGPNTELHFQGIVKKCTAINTAKKLVS